MFASRHINRLPYWRPLGASMAFTLAAFLPLMAYADDPVAFDEMVKTGGWLCEEAPAEECIDHGWSYGDQNGDGQLDRTELKGLRSDMNAWAEWKADDLSGKDRTKLSIARSIANSLDLDDLIQSYDEDDSGTITRNELLADIQVDQRPLPDILKDKQATDWQAIGERLGPFGSLVGSLGAP